MDEKHESNIPSSDRTDTSINWTCKICKDLPNYAGGFLCLREREKNKMQSDNEQRAELILLKYFYALLHLLDDIHTLPECPKPERPASKSAGLKCPNPEHFDRYRKMYNTYANILMFEKGLENFNLKCDICAGLPYALFNDLDMIAKNIHSNFIEESQKLELDEIVTDYYLDRHGSCELWGECPTGVNWLELMHGVQCLKKYIKTKDRKALQIQLSNWNRARATDSILNIGLKTTPKDFQTQDIPSCMLEGKTLVYLDFGIYQLYEGSEVFRLKLDGYVDINKIQLVYSPTHMEEVCRMNNFAFERKRLDNITKICNAHEVLPVDEYLKIVIEPEEVCFARAKKLQNLNDCAEESECARFEALEEQTCSLLGWNQKEMEKYRKAISKLSWIEVVDPQNAVINNESINRVFCQICGSPALLEEFRDYSKKERTFAETREAIRLLYMLMNAIGYHRNKIEKRTKFTHEALYPTYDRKFYRTIRSGFYDVDHLCYASKCDYFFTCDYALSLQAMEIYRYLGCETHVIYCEKKETDPSLPLAVLEWPHLI